MSSDLQSALESFYLDNYLCVATIAAITYDYTLTFSRELDYVWWRPWSGVSTMYLVVRYVGLLWIVTAALYGTPFVPGPVEAYVHIISHFCDESWVSNNQIDASKSVDQGTRWGFLAFLSTADLLMILRVYAMWNRSRTILYVLLPLFTVQVIFTFVYDIIYGRPATLPEITVQLLDFSLCTALPESNKAFMYGVDLIILRLVLATTLVALAVSQALWQSFRMYKATKQWQLNRYIQKLVQDGILYFLMNVLYQVVDLLGAMLPNIVFASLNGVISPAFYILIPRFVISIRELYDSDVRGRVHTDTGFGVGLRSNAGPGDTVSAMAFADVDQGLGVEDAADNSGDLESARMHEPGSNEGIPSESGIRM